MTDQSSADARTGRTGVLLSDDLIFISRIVGTARALGSKISSTASGESLLELVERGASTGVILDLECPGLRVESLIEELAERVSVRPTIVAYGSHVDAERLRAAREAGCDIVLPRSKFVELLPTDLPAWLEASDE